MLFRFRFSGWWWLVPIGALGWGLVASWHLQRATAPGDLARWWWQPLGALFVLAATMGWLRWRVRPTTTSAPIVDARVAGLEAALAAAQTSIWSFHIPSGLVQLDEQWSVILGGDPTPSQVPMSELLRSLHPADRGPALHAVQACFDGRADTYDSEYRVRVGPGHHIWVSSRGRVLERDAAGRAVRMAGTNTDINRRKLAELELARQAEFLNTLNQTTLDLLQSREREEILQTLAQRVVSLLAATRVSIALVEGGHLIPAAEVGDDVSAPHEPSEPADSAAEWQVIQKGIPFLSPASLAANGAVAIFPIQLDGRVLGVLRCDRSVKQDPFTLDERQQGLVLARLAALVIHNANIYAAAVQVAEERSAAMHEQERVFRSVIENLKQGFYTTNVRSLFTYCNEAVAAFAGRSSEELKGTSSFRMVAPEDRARVIRDYRRWADSSETHVVCEFRIESAGGNHMWVEQTTYIQRDESGRVVEFRNFLRDITERKEVEGALRESEERFRAVFDQSPVIIALLSLPEGRFEEINATAERAFDCRAEEVRGRTSTELGVWARPAEREAYLTQLRAHGQVSGFPARMRRADGTEFPSLYCGSLISIGGRQYSLNIIQDITSLEEAQAAYRESEAQMRSMFMESPVPTIMLDLPEATVRTANPAAIALLGFDVDEARGRDTLELNIWPDLSLRQRLLDTLQQDGGAIRGLKTQVRNKRGETLHVIYSAVRVKIGGRFCVLATLLDFTALQRAEEALHRSEDQLRQTQKMESLGTLAGGIAHDFNNTLTAVNGFAQLALADLDPTHPAHESVEMIYQAGQRSRQLVQQILTFSRRNATELRPMLVQQSIDETCAMFRSVLPAMVRLERRIALACPPVRADAVQLHQVLLNLCTNAWQALPSAGGVIELELTPCTLTMADLDELSGLQPGPHLRLRVSDNGRGMDAATRERIFEPFFTTKADQQGTGLGLAVVHSIIVLHQGAITVRSEIGVGTTFEVLLPALPADTVIAPEPQSGPVTAGRGQRVLVVDDDPMTGDVVTRLVRQLGYSADLCADPREALERLANPASHYAALVTDLAMPELPGDQLIAAMREQGATLPVVVVSGYLEPARLERLRAMKVTEILAKPPHQTELARALATALPSS